MENLKSIFTDEFFQIEKICFSGRSEGLIILSFSNYLSNDYKSKGFSEDFCKKRKINFIAVKSKYNYWYHNLNDFYLEKIDSFIEELGGKSNLVVTGSSMGATAALVFAKRLGAKKVLAYSPQFSIECKFEHRYNREIGKFTKSYQVVDIENYSPEISYCIVYDPFDPDNGHYLEFKKTFGSNHINAIPIPFSGHPSIALIRDVGLLSEFVSKYIYTNELISFSEKRKKSLIYFANLTSYLYKKKKYQLGLSVTLKVIEKKDYFDLNAGALFDLNVSLIRFLIKCGRYDDALTRVDLLIFEYPKKTIGYLLAIDLECEAAGSQDKIRAIIDRIIKVGFDISILGSRSFALSLVGINIKDYSI